MRSNNQGLVNKALQQIKSILRLKKSLIFVILLFILSLSASSVFAQNHSPEASQLVQQGKELYNSGQYTKALPIWQQASETFGNKNKPLEQAMSLSNLSLTYQQLSDWEKANKAITKSLDILHSLKTTKEQQRILAKTLDIQGQSQQKTGQSQAALNTWQQAAQIYINLEDRDNKTINQINQAQAMQDLGLYPRACQTLLLSLGLENRECYISEPEITTLKQDLINNYKSNIQKAKAFRSLGNNLRVIGDFQQSQQVLLASLEIAQHWNLPQDESKTLLNLGNTERALAISSAEIRDIQQSETYREQAIIHYQKAAELSSTFLQIQAQINQVELLLEQQNWKKSEELLRQIHTNLERVLINKDIIYAKINYAKNLICLKQKEPNCLNAQKPNSSNVDESSYQEAVQFLETASQDAENLQDKRTRSYAIGIMGRLLESRQEWDKANKYTQQALYDSWQAQASDLSYQWQWQQARLLKAQKQQQKALFAYSQAVNTLKSLRSDLVSLNPEIQFTFRESVEPVYREYVDLLLQPIETTETSTENLQLALLTIDSLQLAELENFFRLVCLDANPVVIDEVTQQNDPTAAVIYPIFLEDRFEIILKLPQQELRHYTTPIENKKEVERILNRLTQSLTQANSQETLPLAQQVYDWLLRPAQEDLAQSQVKTLIFVLDSALRNLPMSVLHNGQQYLIEQYSIALIPSLQLIDPKPFKQQNKRALIAGLSEARGKFAALPFVRQELQQIQTQVPRSVELLNQTFTNEGFKNTVNSAPFSVVHLATHGQFSQKADQTFILTWDDRLNVNQLNNLLRSRDIERNSSIELLVLSACETLTGDSRASLGLAGVAVRAGARSTLATLWQVNDQATTILMERFYGALKDSTLTKADALRQAQLGLLNDPVYKRPHFWAAYVLLGNWL
ncbi:hypothetical protein C7H19_11465 [Aphanothece hegewaldii CCALA 016]|uniref:CHAT domain-containing protein n=2 Tax=Aphanothece TaxID=1121 RepID=A0A2T1LXT4_9CHRO|nr:hypothetical protein C7H19_11465 [Aphanothece hegewaldii CCALA 016]